MTLRYRRRSDRPAFTLVEMLVAMALILFIMVILSEAFVAGLEAFRQLKAIGDMEERLRAASIELRRDLNADHFEGRRRLSDPNFWNVPVREGFFQIIQVTPYMLPAGPDKGYWQEGVDTDGNTSYRAIDHRLHFSVKLRGNQLDKFFNTVLPAGSPLNTPDSNGRLLETVYFNQPADGRFQDVGNVYSSPWAEVAYFLVPDPAGATAGTGTPLFSLYRAQLLVVPDNRLLNWPDPTGQVTSMPLKAGQLSNYPGFSCQAGPADPLKLFFNSPVELAQGTRALPTSALQLKLSELTNDPVKKQAYLAMANRSTLLLTDVISFQVQVLTNQGQSATPANPDFMDLISSSATANFGGIFDTSSAVSTPTGWTRASGYNILAIQVTIRVWDPKTEQARQITIVQDM
jgi:prepilin-type N-terminal cleavage/methylation domain-containing protein